MRRTNLGLIAFALILALISKPGLAEDKQSFKSWLGDLRREALAKGISQATFDEAFAEIKPIPRVIELDRNQPEFRMTLTEYLDRVTPKHRIIQGRKELAKHHTLLMKLYDRYRVEPWFLIAFWGIETSYGRLSGDFPVIGSIATLAYDGRRSRFFRRELMHALRILEDAHISAGKMRGSWAGAMGQLQFMPSTFQAFAVDYDGDGKIDIWDNLGDAFASAAHYLAKSGWVKGQSWGFEVRLPEGFAPALPDLNIRKPLSQWQSLGVRRPGGQDLTPSPDLMASVIQPDGPKGKAFIALNNYRVILKWNRSYFFGVAVGTLADRIKER
ncbi:MAG: lytic murein transglycosylase [Desulfatiglandaceae bacterium]